MSRTLYVSRVEKADLSDLEDLFSTVGDVESSNVEKIPDSGQEPEFGIFEMATEQQAMDCAERFNGYNLTNGNYLSVSIQRPLKKPAHIAKGKSIRGKRKM